MVMDGGISRTNEWKAKRMLIVIVEENLVLKIKFCYQDMPKSPLNFRRKI